ncbi:hypothetical protein DDV93_19240 [Cereibacter johrii]|nr:hypothetical protein DDV93_19240 [Cereibacter johrii]
MAVFTAGGSVVGDVVMDAVVDAGAQEAEKALDAFWEREESRRAAITQLRVELVKLTRVGCEDGDPPNPLVVVVDELDRCRPDYALALLEIIKHFFSVPSVHFVLGVNLEALEHSVRARYGHAFPADRYLDRFITLRMALSDVVPGRARRAVVVDYFSKCALELPFSREFVDLASDQIRLVHSSTGISMRDVNRVISHLALFDPAKAGQYKWGVALILVSMTLFRCMAPALYVKAIRARVTRAEVTDFFGITPAHIDQGGPKFDDAAERLYHAWDFVVTDGESAQKETVARWFDDFGMTPRVQSLPRQLSEEFLETFSFPRA